MEADETGLIREAIYRACVAAGIRQFRPDSRAADQQSALASALLGQWIIVRARDRSETTGRDAALE